MKWRTDMSVFDAPTMRELIETQAQKYGEKTFIKFIKDKQVNEKSYLDLRNDSLCVCRYIRSLSERKMHVAVIGKTNYDYIACIAGVLMSGSIVIPLAHDISGKEAADILNRADADVLIYDNNFKPNAQYVKNHCRRIEFYKDITDSDDFQRIYSDYSESSEYARLSDFKVDKDECCIIIFTSGTTGVKNGVMLSSNALIGNITYNDYYPIFKEGESALSVLPMNHVYCFSGDFIKNLKDGITLCLNENISDLRNNLLTFRPHSMRVVPMIAAHLLQRIKMQCSRNPDMTKQEAAESVLGDNLKWLISGGAYLNPEIVSEFSEYGIMIRQGYGMTEAGCRISVPDVRVSEKSVGRVIDICKVRIRDGEIQVDTPTKMLGYYKKDDETKNAFTDDGWLKTGDIGEVTDDGQLYITGRVKNLIILSNGENVSPEAIEKKLNAFPIIDESMIFSKDDMLYASIYPNSDYVHINNISNVSREIEKIIDSVNLTAKPSHYLSGFELRKEPLPRTQTGKLKRNNVSL